MSATRRLGQALPGKPFLRGVAAVAVALVLWEIGARLHLPLFTYLPAPSVVLAAAGHLVLTAKYWQNWMYSFERVIAGFLLAQVIGIPFALAMAMSRFLYDLEFPIFEILRPIPPLAWVPAAVIFWPTTELSIIFVIFLGAFFTVVLNVIAGARSIDARYVRAARSLGSQRRDIFRRIVLPATVPSIVTGMAVGMGITWEVVVAAEMIAGKSGLGYFTWEAYVGGNFPRIVIGMASIGIAGYLSSGLIRFAGKAAAPWQKSF